MFRNPISAKRLQFLTTQLERKLKNQPDLLFALRPKLQHLANADPSPSGEYSGWILNLLLKKDIDLPEDGQKLNELLQTFHKVKQRLPQEFRDINRFNSYSQLRITLLPLLPTLRSIAELELEGSELIATESINEAVYQLYKLTTPEAASAAAKGSGWCVCNKETAKTYLNDGPLYLLVRNDKRHALIHGPSLQVMDINDVPVRPDTDSYYKDVQFILEKFLPETICDDTDQHRRQANLKPSIPRDHRILNVFCQQCEETCCLDCGGAYCEVGDECTNAFCYEHVDRCKECKDVMCSECRLECCRYSSRSGDICTTCGYECVHCSEKLCDMCRHYVECCDGSVCESHHGASCAGCDTTFCTQHMQELAHCDVCSDDSYYCESCRDDWINCDRCEKISCNDCSFECESCGERGCGSCKSDCIGCDKTLCQNCSNHCNWCDGAFCENCPHEKCHGLQGKRAHSFHGEVKFCEIHPVEESEELEQYCEECIEVCYKCKKDMCDLCAEWCADGEHSMCPQCNSINVCSVCGETMCYPEDHIQCAYSRRKKRRFN